MPKFRNEVLLQGIVEVGAEVRFNGGSEMILTFKLLIDEPHITYEVDSTKRHQRFYSVMRIYPSNTPTETVQEWAAIIKKGCHIAITGEIFTRSWKKNNQWLSDTGILANRFSIKNSNVDKSNAKQ